MLAVEHGPKLPSEVPSEASMEPKARESWPPGTSVPRLSKAKGCVGGGSQAKKSH
jgi:hypothetical protein